MKKKKQSQPKPLETKKMGSIPVPERKFPWAAALIVAGITFLVYLPALRNGFVGAWDDNVYVYNNQAIQSLSLEFFKWVFTSEAIGLWHPMTMFSLAVDYAGYGLNPWGYHLTNNIFHTLNTLLVFILVFRLVEQVYPDENRFDKKAFIAGAVTALLFGIHPLHVESVAWISERKDVLCAFFYLLSLLAYLKYVSSPDSKKPLFYIISLILFIAALMSKPMAVSLPLVLLILDFYPLGRLSIDRKYMNIKPILIEKLPFFIFSFVVALATLWASQVGGALRTSTEYPLMGRVFGAIYAYIFYLTKMILPNNLAPFYPHPTMVGIGPFIIKYLGSLIIFMMITFFSIRSFKRNRFFLVAWLYYVVTLVPVIGIIQVGGQIAADRYTYLPGLGPFLLIGLGVAYLYEIYDHRKLLIIFASFFLLWMSKMTVTQINIWKDPVTLWSHEMKMFPSVYISYNNRGNAYKEAGEFQKAIKDYDEAIKLNPKEPLLYVNRGVAYSYLGKHQEGTIDLNEAIKLNPKYLLAYYNRGALFQESGDFKQAIKDYGKVIELNPKHAEAYYNRGMAYDSLGDYQEALKDYSRAIELDRKHIDAYYKRGGIFFEKGDYQQAINDYSKITELNTQHADAYYNRGVVYNSMGNYLQALNDFDIAIELNSKDSMYYTNRGSAYSSVGNHEQAIKNYNKAIELNSKDPYAYYNLGNVYAQIGNTEQAIINYKKAADLGLKEAQSLLK